MAILVALPIDDPYQRSNRSLLLSGSPVALEGWAILLLVAFHHWFVDSLHWQ